MSKEKNCSTSQSVVVGSCDSKFLFYTFEMMQKKEREKKLKTKGKMRKLISRTGIVLGVFLLLLILNVFLRFVSILKVKKDVLLLSNDFGHFLLLFYLSLSLPVSSSSASASSSSSTKHLVKNSVDNNH